MTDGKITIRPLYRAETIVRSFAVSGAVNNMAAQYSGKPFRPETITVKLQDGELRSIAVSGRRVLVSGQFGRDTAARTWYRVQELETDAPSWVKETLAEVLRQEAKR